MRHRDIVGDFRKWGWECIIQKIKETQFSHEQLIELKSIVDEKLKDYDSRFNDMN